MSKCRTYSDKLIIPVFTSFHGFQDSFPKVTTQQDLDGKDLDNLTPHTKVKLNNEEIARYSRQLILPEIGVKGIFFLY